MSKEVMRCFQTASALAFVSIFSSHAYAEEWWLLSYANLKCERPLTATGETYTPESIIKLYKGCYPEPFDSGKGTYLNCNSSRLKTNFIFTKSLKDCQNWADKLKPLHIKAKG
jgi:hypothetical protein